MLKQPLELVKSLWDLVPREDRPSAEQRQEFTATLEEEKTPAERAAASRGQGDEQPAQQGGEAQGGRSVEIQGQGGEQGVDSMAEEGGVDQGVPKAAEGDQQMLDLGVGPATGAGFDVPMSDTKGDPPPRDS